MKRIIGMIAVAAMLATAVPAFANGSIHHNTFEGGNAAASATGGSASANSTNVNVNSNQQGQNQGQQQGQHQSQVGVNVQGQKQDASNKGVSQSVKFESSMIPGVAVAPGLAAGGSQVCLGSFSVGLSGPMAGVAFGKTVQDEGCAKRQLFILLYNIGDARAGAVLDVLYRDAMGEAKPEPVAVKRDEAKASVVEAAPQSN